MLMGGMGVWLGVELVDGVGVDSKDGVAGDWLGSAGASVTV